jgi:hypothetical protein
VGNGGDGKRGRFGMRCPWSHVPCWEKAGAGGLVVLSLGFGFGFMNAGDSTEISTKLTCPPDSVLIKNLCHFESSERPPQRSEGLAEQISDVVISLEGGSPSPGAIGESTTPGRVNFQLPLFQIGVRHNVSFLNAAGTTIDGFNFVVPEASGPMAVQRTEQGGQAQCVIDHRMPILGGNSGTICTYDEPAGSDTPETPPDGGTSGETVEPDRRTVEETTDGLPWSLLFIPGGISAVLGGLTLAERRHREGGFDPETGTYPDWQTR